MRGTAPFRTSSGNGRTNTCVWWPSSTTTASQTDDIESVRKGIELIHQKLLDTLHAKGVQEIEAIGSELDTDLHEAVAKLPVEDDKKGKIIDVVQKGYKLKDKVVRYAKVVVGE